MRIGLIGAGKLGGTLARHLARLGHQVSIANSRGPESLTVLAAEIGATPVSVADAVRAGDIVIISIPTRAVADLRRELFAGVPGRVVIDTGNYHPELRDGRIDAIDRGMHDSQWVAVSVYLMSLLPGACWNRESGHCRMRCFPGPFPTSRRASTG